MNLASLSHQLRAGVILDLLSAIDISWNRIRYFRFGAWTLPGTNDNSAQNTGRDGSNSLGVPGSLITFHSQPDSPEARENNGR